MGKEIKFQPKKCKRISQLSDMIKVHYTLWIHQTSLSGDKGVLVETSHDTEAMEFRLGAQSVIPAWEQALEGACEGEKMELVVPPEFGYGEKGQGEKIPPLATLHFEVEVLEITETNMFEQMDTN